MWFGLKKKKKKSEVRVGPRTEMGIAAAVTTAVT